MADVSFALEAKSDQLNALDIVGAEPVIRIREVRVQKSPQQPVWMYFDGDNGRPWKPSKGMLRVLAGAYGRDSAAWIGKRVRIYYEPSVKYAGADVGGIRIRALSDISERGLAFSLRINQKKTEPYHVPLLVVDEKPYPADKFDKALPVMTEKMRAGELTLQQVIAQCQKTGTLTADQLARLESVAPVEIEEQEPAGIVGTEPAASGGEEDFL
jgi:hypothetical protein